jgi:proteasome alpha subunit
MYSPYDFNQSIAHRAEYVEERLKAGMPVVGISYEGGALLFTVKRTQRKVFEIYDQLMYSAIGNQADVEAVRLAAIDFAHQEGFSRSPDDVSIQRLVGFAISPPLKRAFGDPMTTPNVMRALFVEIGKTPETDQFFVLNYDGEFSNHSLFAIAAGSDTAEAAMRESLAAHDDVPTLQVAIERAKSAFRAGLSRIVDEDEPEYEGDLLEDALKTGQIEAAILERNSPRESKFRLLKASEVN